MMKIGAREIVFLVLLFVVPLGVWYLVFTPRNQAREAMEKEIQDKKQLLSNLRQVAPEVTSKIEDEISQLKHAMDFARQQQPREEDPAKVMEGLTLLAQSNNLKPDVQISPEKEPDLENLTEIEKRYRQRKILMQVSGRFMDLYAFLQTLENQPRMLRIDRLSISRRGAGRQSTVRASLEVQQFYVRETPIEATE